MAIVQLVKAASDKARSSFVISFGATSCLSALVPKINQAKAEIQTSQRSERIMNIDSCISFSK